MSQVSLGVIMKLWLQDGMGKAWALQLYGLVSKSYSCLSLGGENSISINFHFVICKVETTACLSTRWNTSTQEHRNSSTDRKALSFSSLATFICTVCLCQETPPCKTSFHVILSMQLLSAPVQLSCFHFFVPKCVEGFLSQFLQTLLFPLLEGLPSSEVPFHSAQSLCTHIPHPTTSLCSRHSPHCPNQTLEFFFVLLSNKPKQVGRDVTKLLYEL